MIALFMAGGSGTRLWPLSRENNPKQLHCLVGEKSLMTQTIERISPLINAKDVWIVTNESYAERISGHSPSVPKEQIITEPFALGTNLAVGLGAIHIAKNDSDAVIVVGWADSYIGNEANFLAALQRAEALACESDGVILAVNPTYPATSYGYIETGVAVPGHNGAFRIARFEEKPNADRAKDFCATGSHFWNPGISVWKVSTLLSLIRRFKPDHYNALRYVAEAIGTLNLNQRMKEAFTDLDPIAIDHAIFEKAENMATIPVDLDWNDIGSWSAIYDVQSNKDKKDCLDNFCTGHSNVSRGSVVSIDTERCLIFGQKRLIATLGISDLVIVETDDAILIVHKDKTDRLKELHSQVKILAGAQYL